MLIHRTTLLSSGEFPRLLSTFCKFASCVYCATSAQTVGIVSHESIAYIHGMSHSHRHPDFTKGPYSVGLYTVHTTHFHGHEHDTCRFGHP